MNSKVYLILVSVIGFPAVSAIIGIGKQQSAGAQGNITCRGVPANNVTVTLYDSDLLWDSKLDEVQTIHDGTFQLHGTKSELTAIEPYVEISHHCNVKDLLVISVRRRRRHIEKTSNCGPSTRIIGSDEDEDIEM
ncbi:unnamed protein product [Angiostrongylus costaricensis]|uniref:Transthyretin-like family protein n=1 Tax=Angiostrongylus costaricensis TaxID=334426 RepID=A0A0R3Q1Z0_ANGCS|nr:unnamed protein product [Angiostrongylus costaricensis]